MGVLNKTLRHAHHGDVDLDGCRRSVNLILTMSSARAKSGVPVRKKIIVKFSTGRGAVERVMVGVGM